MPTRPSVFISYRCASSADLARYVYDKLTAWGADVFLDAEDINAGRFAGIIEREIIQRDYFLAILAPDTLESEWVVREIQTALRHRKAIILLATPDFSLANAALSPEIGELAAYDEIGYDHDYADAALERVARALGLAPHPPVTLSPGEGEKTGARSRFIRILI